MEMTDISINAEKKRAKMKKFLLSLFCVFLFSVNGWAQEEKCWFDDIRYLCKTKDGKPYTGFSVIYSKEGWKQAEVNFVDGKLLGDFKFYNSQGKLIEQGTYLEETLFHGGTAKIGYVPIASYISYYPNGQIKEKGGNYKDCDGQGGITKEGHWTEYYENGVLKSDGNYKTQMYGNPAFCRSKENGRWLYSSEKRPEISWEYTYVNGVKEGPYVRSLRISPQEVITLVEGTYANGKTVGDWKTYYPDGNLWREQHYNTEGKPVGLWTCYDSDGKSKTLKAEEALRLVLGCWSRPNHELYSLE